MTLVGALVLIVIAGVCGSIGSGLAGYTHKGCLASIAFGFLGAWLGGWMAGQAHLPLLYVLHFRGESFPVIWSIIGAAILSAVMSILTARKPYEF
jgi:uncharacterized membrane protein YeaQ/YmgE (transglycosylase-associated protein family)